MWGWLQYQRSSGGLAASLSWGGNSLDLVGGGIDGGEWTQREGRLLLHTLGGFLGPGISACAFFLLYHQQGGACAHWDARMVSSGLTWPLWALGALDLAENMKKLLVSPSGTFSSAVKCFILIFTVVFRLPS